jgi:hypothetical protein
MRPETIVTLVITFAAVFLAVILLTVGDWFGALVTAVGGVVACKVLPKKIAENRNEAEKR